MLFELVVGDAAVKVLIHLAHYVVNLLLRDGEAYSFQQILELITLQESVLVQVYLVEHFRQCQIFLFEDLDQVFENIKLNVKCFFFLFNLFKSIIIILEIEFFDTLIDAQRVENTKFDIVLDIHNEGA